MSPRRPADNDHPNTTETPSPSDVDQTLDGETVHEHDPEATIEGVDPDTVEEPADPEQTIVDPRMAETPDPESTVDADQTIDAPAPGDDLTDVAETDIEQTIDQQWQDSEADGASPSLTLKSDPNRVMDQGFDFSLKPREVAREGTAPVENPDYVREKVALERSMRRGRSPSIGMFRSRSSSRGLRGARVHATRSSRRR